MSKPLTEFYKKGKFEKGLRYWCIDCWLKKGKDWRKKNKDYRKIWYPKRQKELKDKYGLGAGTIGRYGFELALKIYDKYERKCIMCGEKNDLTLHHLDGKGRNYENKGLKPNNEEKNLILVCRKCHGSIHGKEGRGIKKTPRK